MKLFSKQSRRSKGGVTTEGPVRSSFHDADGGSVEVPDTVGTKKVPFSRYEVLPGFVLFLLLFHLLTGEPTRDTSWMLYDDSQVAVIQITIDPDALAWMYENVESDSLHLAQFHFQNAFLDEEVADVGFRLRGNTSREARKKSFKISFNTFVPGRQFHNVDKMNLNGEHNDPGIVRSKLCWDWYHKIGLTASRAASAALYINDVYYGLYISVEHVDDAFLSNHFTDDTGNLWKCLWPADLSYRGGEPEDYYPYVDEDRPYELKTHKEEYDYTQLAHLIGIIHDTPDELFADSLDRVLCIPEVLKYFATNVLMGSWDDYRFLMNNYYLYHQPDINKFHWIPYDYDNTFGVDWFDIEWAEVDPYEFAVIDGGPRPLADRILADPGLHNLYTHFLEFYRENLFDLPLWEDSLDSLHEQLIPWAVQDTFRRLDYGFDENGGLDDFNNSYDLPGYENQHVKHSLKDFVTLRNASLPAQLYYRPASPSIYALAYTPQLPTDGDTIFVGASVFDNDGLIFTQIHFTDATGVSSYFPMVSAPVENSMLVEDMDRWTGNIPPQFVETGSSFEIISMDQTGSIAHYPASGIPLTLHPQTDPDLKLNEFLARNDEVIADEYDEFDDWVELYNLSGETILLDGIFLSDTPNNLTKWVFPAAGISIGPGGFLLVWCDNDEEQGDLHTNFKLDGDGEFLAVTAPDGVTVLDSLSFGEQTTDISLGRAIDGTGIWIQQVAPSPGLSNNGDCVFPGDMNCDGQLDVSDLLICVSIIMGDSDPTDLQLQQGDVDGSGEIDILDVVIVVYEIIG